MELCTTVLAVLGHYLSLVLKVSNYTNIPHNFINVKMLLPVSFNSRDMANSNNSNHHSRHF